MPNSPTRRPSSTKRRRKDPQDQGMESDDSDNSDAVTTVNARYQFGDADIVLISSDNVHFRVHSYQLMAASPVFRGMMAVGKESNTPQEVVLTDVELENAATLTQFLDLIYGRPYKEWYLKHLDAHKVEALLLIAHKYDAGPALQLLTFIIRDWLRDGSIDPFSTFLVGCLTNDVPLCARAIRQGAGWFWAPTESRGKKGLTWQVISFSSYGRMHTSILHTAVSVRPTDSSCVVANQRAPKCIVQPTGPFYLDRYEPHYGEQIFDLTAAPLDAIRMIPAEYGFALMRAIYDGHRKVSYDETDFQLMGDEFERLMKMISELR